jgi:hypothetical protein
MWMLLQRMLLALSLLVLLLVLLQRMLLALLLLVLLQRVLLLVLLQRVLLQRVLRFQLILLHKTTPTIEPLGLRVSSWLGPRGGCDDHGSRCRTYTTCWSLMLSEEAAVRGQSGGDDAR